MPDLLIHSLSEFQPLIFEVLEATQPEKIAEVGTERGVFAKLLGEWAAPRGGAVYPIDPAPPEDCRALLATQENCHLVERTSLDAIPDLDDIDCWFIDGDHNWYTVFHELTAIAAQCKKSGKPMLTFLHDVCWPWGQRDLYYAPDSIPPQYRHAYTYDYGVTLGNVGVINGGFRGCGAFAVATHEGGPRNGVLTAVADFVATQENPPYFCIVPAVMGLGILFSRTAAWTDAVHRILSPYHMNPLVAKLEENRLRNYLKVIELQDEANGAVRSS